MQSTKWELYEYQRSRSVIDLGPNHLHSLFLNFFSSITADFNVSSAIRWAIQDQWSSGFHLASSVDCKKVMLCTWSFWIWPAEYKQICYIIGASCRVKRYLTHIHTFFSAWSWGPATFFPVDWSWNRFCLFKLGNCQLLMKGCTLSTGKHLGYLPRNSVVRLTDCLNDMTLVVDWDVKLQIK